MTNMNWELFKDFFDESWHYKIKPWVESEDCDNVYDFLKKESKRGKQIAPLYNNVYKSFKLTSFDDIKVVIVGLSPYHTYYKGKPIADGVLMSCSITNRLQPSLEQFYNAIEKELYNGLDLNITRNPDLSYLAKQGVLLINASLTVEKDKPGSHLDIWFPFMKYLFEEVLFYTGAPVIFLGKEASKLERYTNPFTVSISLSHPASASYSDMEWDSKGAFKTVNNIIRRNNNEQIKWM